MAGEALPTTGCLSRVDELEEYLTAQTSEAELDSSGSFTLDRQKALAKLAQFQLPGEYDWSLKVVQAVVASGAPQLVITLGSTGTTFEWKEGFGLDELESAFFSPEPSPSAALDHLRTALWTVGYANMRPFQYRPAGSTRSLVWNGEGFIRVACAAATLARLTVSLRTRQQDQSSWFLLRELEAATHNSDLLALLRRQAYTSPIPLMVDGYRLDALQRCPTHGVGENRIPIALLQANLASAPIGLPPATLGYRPMAPKGPAPPTFATNAQLNRAGCFAMVIGYLEREPCYSRLVWVLDGVAIGEDLLSIEGRVSAAVFVSAAGLPTDLTGFTLTKGVLKTERKQAALNALAPAVKPLVLDFRKQIADERSSNREFATLVLGVSGLFAGIGIFLSVFPAFVPALALGGVGIKLLRSKGVMMNMGYELAAALEQLKAAWPEGLLDEAEPGKPARPLPPKIDLVRRPEPELSKRPDQPKWRRRFKS